MCENPIPREINGEIIYVKCGKCILCRRKKCRQWAIKLYHESLYYKKMCMITLTFRTKFLLRPLIKELTKYKQRRKNDGTIEKKKIKYKTMVNPKYIENVKETGWLVTNFLKRFRKKISKKTGEYISMFAVGEHGTQNTHRAHWHIIIFGVDRNTLESVYIGKTKKNKEIWFSKEVDELWKQDGLKIGKHTISDVTNATIKYVANYTMKKMYKKNNLFPTVMRFSNRAKIGTKWLRRNHKSIRCGVLKDNEGFKYPIPESYIRELSRYNDVFNTSMDETLANIETLKELKMIEMKKKGLLSLIEMKKKARRLEFKNKMDERDYF